MYEKVMNKRGMIYGVIGGLLALFLLWFERAVIQGYSVFWDLVFIASWALLGWIFGRTIFQLNRALDTDDLTQLNNYKSMQKQLEYQLKIARLRKQELSLLMIDIDYFKIMNDLKGHLVGDAMLGVLATIIKESFPKTSIPFRWGGEEFVVLLPNCSNAQGLELAENFRMKVEASEDFEYQTVSVGVASCNGDVDKDVLFEKADQAMYKAKVERNQVSNAGLINKSQE